jgi:hypothetical protein
MKKIATAKFTGSVLLITFVLLLDLHFLVLMRFVPAAIVWGGRVAADQSNLYQLEIIAIAAILRFLGLVIAKLRKLKLGVSNRWINVGIWAMFGYLILNTLGNFASGISAETLVFGPLTIVMGLSALRLALEK